MKIATFFVSKFSSKFGKQNVVQPFPPIPFFAFYDLNISDYH
jgi:hypothetical protein